MGTEFTLFGFRLISLSSRLNCRQLFWVLMSIAPRLTQRPAYEYGGCNCESADVAKVLAGDEVKCVYPTDV